MIEIADESEVSRATLYNHYRDKNAVISALIAAEVEHMVALANKARTPADALEALSLYISADLEPEPPLMPWQRYRSIFRQI